MAIVCIAGSVGASRSRPLVALLALLGVVGAVGVVCQRRTRRYMDSYAQVLGQLRCHAGVAT